jgi:hypothetical protein
VNSSTSFDALYPIGWNSSCRSFEIVYSSDGMKNSIYDDDESIKRRRRIHIVETSVVKVRPM